MIGGVIIVTVIYIVFIVLLGVCLGTSGVIEAHIGKKNCGAIIIGLAVILAVITIPVARNSGNDYVLFAEALCIGLGCYGKSLIDDG